MCFVTDESNFSISTQLSISVPLPRTAAAPPRAETSGSSASSPHTQDQGAAKARALSFPGLFLSPARSGTETVTRDGRLTAWKQDSGLRSPQSHVFWASVSQMDQIPGAWVTAGRAGLTGKPGEWAQPPLPLRVGQLRVQASCPFVPGKSGKRRWGHLLSQPFLYLGALRPGEELPPGSHTGQEPRP